MSYDPMAAMALTDSVYDELLKDAEMDNRLGTSKRSSPPWCTMNWASGDPRMKFGLC